jgi:hypothetical protein
MSIFIGVQSVIVTESPPVSPSVVANILMTQKVKVTSGTLLSTRSRQSFIACLLRGPSDIVLQSERRNRQMRDKREMPTGTLSQDVVPTYLALRGRQDEIAKM